MKANEVLDRLGISRVTLCKYVKSGIIKVDRLKNGQYNYDEESVYEFLGQKFNRNHKVNISYSRVSTQAQKDQLKEQTLRIYNYCISKGIELDEQIEDIKSGMDADRKGFQKLIERVVKGEIGLLVIENKDRLTRFNFDTLQLIFKYYGTQIMVLNDALDNRTYEQELTEDLISIIHYFTMKSYSHRRKLNKIRKELEEDSSVNTNN
jgi:predicted site-specific integrase-resolvase